MLRARWFYLLSALLSTSLLGAGCGSDAAAPAPASSSQPEAPTPAAPPQPEPSEQPPTPAEPAAEVAAPRFPAPRAGEQVDVPAGTLHVGSRPGLRSRSPLREADLVALQVPAFRMDRLPYPNDPAQPPRTQVTRPQAEALCAERQQRLCDELEWERACKG
ncbi:MAG: hypothetical protein KBB95_04400, partial [Deltaproteobacteria bacterium]|nr:hypothetical protein [Deltaproteobacteria bacterium]